MDFISALQQENTTTENGMVTNSSSLNDCVDLFFKIGGSRKAEEKEVVRQFSLAFIGSPLEAMKILFWGRDVRGGAGERRFFRICLNYLAKNHPDVLKKNLHLVPDFGRWDDIFALCETPMEQYAFEFISAALSNSDRLCAKWMPRKGPIANSMRKHFGLTPKEYRKLLVGSTDVVEQKMCAKDWASIEYSKVPSVAAARYQRAFMKNDGDHYKAYIAALQAPTENKEVKINAAAAYPYDVIKSLNRGVQEVAIEQWKALPNFLEGSKDMILPVVDVSGSMMSIASGTTSCMDISISLGLYLSERNEGPFKDYFITFSESPELQKTSGNLKERYDQMQSSEWGMNTDLTAVFNLILDQAVKHGVAQDDMPSKILIISDMEFDRAIEGDTSLSAMQMIRSKYSEAGYKAPDVIFWNVQSRGHNVPVRFDETGTALISGFSPSIMKSILGGKNITPISIMYETINNQRYENITV